MTKMGVMAGVMSVVGATTVVGMLAVNCSGASGRSATESAVTWSAKLPGNVNGLECARTDSDGDGYVSCTVFREGKEPLFIECAGAFTLNEGCRAPKMQMVRQ